MLNGVGVVGVGHSGCVWLRTAPGGVRKGETFKRFKREDDKVYQFNSYNRLSSKQFSRCSECTLVAAVSLQNKERKKGTKLGLKFTLKQRSTNSKTIRELKEIQSGEKDKVTESYLICSD